MSFPFHSCVNFLFQRGEKGRWKGNVQSLPHASLTLQKSAGSINSLGWRIGHEEFDKCTESEVGEKGGEDAGEDGDD